MSMTSHPRASKEMIKVFKIKTIDKWISVKDCFAFSSTATMTALKFG